MANTEQRPYKTETASELLSVRLTPSQRAYLEQQAAIRGETLAECLRRLIDLMISLEEASLDTSR